MTSPSYALAQDPAYLAFLRASGLQQDVATADAARRRDAVNMALGLQDDALDTSGTQERRGISTSQEGRGVYRSGETLRRLGEQESGEATRRSAIQLAGAGQLGDIESNLTSTIANQQIRGAEAGLTQTGDRALSDGLFGLSVDPSLRTAAAPTALPAQPTPLPAPLSGQYRRRSGNQEF